MIAGIIGLLSVIGTSVICIVYPFHTAWDLLWAIPVFFVCLYLALTFLLFLSLFLISSFVNRKKEFKGNTRMARWTVRAMCEYLIYFGGARIRTVGLENLPKNSRFLMVGNHTSMFDPIIVMHAMKHTNFSFVSKPENFNIPIVGGFLHMCGFLPLDRENPRNAVGTMRAAARLIEQGEVNVGIYPEGTRNKVSEELQPFHSGSFKIAKMAKCPIVVVSLHNARKISKNFPLRRTDVILRVDGVISIDTVTSETTDVLSSIAQEWIKEGLKASQREEDHA